MSTVTRHRSRPDMKVAPTQSTLSHGVPRVPLPLQSNQSQSPTPSILKIRLQSRNTMWNGVASRSKYFKASRISRSLAQSLRIHAENDEGKDPSVTFRKSSTTLVDGNNVGSVCALTASVRLSRHRIHMIAIRLAGYRRGLIKGQVRVTAKLYKPHQLP